MHNPPPNPLQLSRKLWIYSEGRPGVFGDGKARLLEELDRRGSLREAASALGISYRKAWGDLRKAEQTIGQPLLDRSRGGSGGGGSTLTAEARRLLHAYRLMCAGIDAAIATQFNVFQRSIMDAP